MAAVVLGFDVLVGLMTSLRMMGAALDDMRATHGMNRIRHGYVRIAPSVAQFLVTGTHDDLRSIATTYSFGGRPVDSGIGYTLSTSHAMVVLITALLGGTWAAVLGLALGLGLPPALLAGGGIAVIVFLSLALRIRAQVTGQAQRLESRFPTPTDQDHVGS